MSVLAGLDAELMLLLRPCSMQRSLQCACAVVYLHDASMLKHFPRACAGAREEPGKPVIEHNPANKLAQP